MIHGGPFQTLPFCDSVKLIQVLSVARQLLNSMLLHESPNPPRLKPVLYFEEILSSVQRNSGALWNAVYCQCPCCCSLQLKEI